MTNAMPENYANALDGFEITTPDKQPFITLDKQRRFYVNASLRKLIGVQAYDRVAIAYNPAKTTIAVIKFEHADAINADTYALDARHYASARRFCADYRFDADAGPYTFAYDRKASAPGIYYFRLKGGLGVKTKPVTKKERQPKTDELVFDAPIEYVRLTDDNRLHMSGISNCGVHFRKDTDTIEVSYEAFTGSVPINVDNNGMTPHLIEFADDLPGRYDHTETPGGDRLLFKREKAL